MRFRRLIGGSERRLGVRRGLLNFWKATDGGIVVWAAFAVPAIAVLSIGATELSAVAHDRSRLQDAADGAALMGAAQLNLAGAEPAIEQAKAHARAQIADIAARTTLTAEAELVNDGQGLKVSLVSNRASFFGNTLPPGGFTVRAQATAAAMNRSPLCVIALEAGGGAKLTVQNSAKLNAPECGVYSNGDIRAFNVSTIQARSTHAVGTATGRITPEPLAGALPVPDPYAAKPLTIPPCDSWRGEVEYAAGDHQLEPGVHCGDYSVDAFATLTLKPGTHYFTGMPDAGGKLEVKGQGKLKGDGVVLYFSKHSKFAVSDQGDIDLQGARTGPDAGMLMIGARDATKQWMLSSKAIRRMEGVIYVPAAEIRISGGNVFTVAQESKWTIAIAKRITITDALTFVVNSDYKGSTVPLPAGAGLQENVRLLE